MTKVSTKNTARFLPVLLQELRNNITNKVT